MATSYHREHVKTSIAAEAIDLDAARLRYYHNASLYELAGDDYRGIFRIAGSSEDVLPPYAELVRFDVGTRLSGEDLRAAARSILRHHMTLIPPGNPFERFGDRLERDLPSLLEGDAAMYHAYAFATLRMAGAGFELLASHVEWLLGDEGDGASAALARIVEASKVLGFKLARRRPFDAAPTIDDMGRDWTEAIGSLDDAVR